MARIRAFKEESLQVREHPTQVDCGFTHATINGKRYLQLNTYGSAARKIPGKVSQTLQLDEEAARELTAILREAFPGR